MSHATRERPIGAVPIGLAFVALLVRLPALAEPFGIDQGIFATSAFGMSHGLAMYRDVWDQKPPGIHLTYRAAMSVLGFHSSTLVWLDAAAAMLTMWMLYLAARDLRGRAAGLTAAAAYTLGTIPAAIYSYGGFLERAVPETFIAALAAVALRLAVRIRLVADRRPMNAFWFGLVIGAAMIFKPTAIVYAALLAWALTPAGIRSGWRLVAASALGVAMPLAAVAIWLAARGALHDAYVAVVSFNRAYVALGLAPRFFDAFAHELWRRTKTDPLWTLAACGWIAGAIEYARTRRAPPLWAAGTVACAASTLAAAANGVRLYTTYFVPEAIGLSLLSATPFLDASTARRRVPVAAVLSLAATVFVLARTSTIPRAVARFRADIAQLSGRGVPPSEYLDAFGGYANGRGYSARANAELAEFVRAHTVPSDRVYIFGMAPVVYVASERLPAQRFIWVGPAVSGLLADPAFSIDALAADLAAAQPAYIILERHNRDSLLGWTTEGKFADPAMQRTLAAYAVERTIEDFVLYRRRDAAGSEPR